MVAILHPDIDALSAPARDGDVLMHPPIDQIDEQVHHNRQLRSEYDFELAGRRASDWRPKADAPLCMLAGHQPDFFHPGVWAKGIVTDSLARKFGGAAGFLVVDSDVPGRVEISLPDESGGILAIRHVSARVNPDSSWEHFNRAEFASVLRALEDVARSGQREPAAALVAFCDAFRHAAASQRPDYVAAWIDAMRRCDEWIGSQPLSYFRISEVFSFGSDGPAAAWAAHIILHAGEFAPAYNDALARYRQDRGIRGSQHPIPDLAVNADQIELPFWLLQHERPRARLIARRQHGAVAIEAAGQIIGELKQADAVRDPAAALRRALGPWQLRPRALAQTMFARLFLCDLFVHGIGGAKYDQITDNVIRGFFGVEPPSYACVTATLRLPLPRRDASPVDLARLRRLRRDVRYNPHRIVDLHETDGRLREWVHARQAAINESQRLREERAGDRPARRDVFRRIRHLNDQISPFVARKMPVDEELEVLKADLEHNQIADSREWFFGLFPDDKLRQLAASLRQQFD